MSGRAELPPDLAELAAGPGAVPTSVVARLTGTSPDVWEAMARRGDAPIRAIRVGRCWRWPREALLALLLGAEADDTDAPPADELGARRRTG